MRKGSREQQLHEFADVLAWVATLANQMGIDLNESRVALRQRLPHLFSAPLRLLTPSG